MMTKTAINFHKSIKYINPEYKKNNIPKPMLVTKNLH